MDLQGMSGALTGEPSRLMREALEELVGNACECSVPGSPVRVAASVEEAFRLAVTDRGEGMTTEQIERLKALGYIQ